MNPEGRNGPQANMQRHFSQIADSYRDLRTTDLEPVLYIKEKLGGRAGLRAADIGCGAGRYDVLLCQNLQGLHLTCVDITPEMLDEARAHLAENGFTGMAFVASGVEDLRLEARSLDCVFTFNAVHHFDLDAFLRKAGAFIREDGRVFVYTRLPSQNEQTIWGTHFPGFAERETRLFGLEEMETAVGNSEGLEIEEVRNFRFSRASTLEWLLRQAREKHYSTFALYSPEAFEAAVAEFESNIRRHFPNPGRVEWFDENILLVLRSAASA